MQQWLETLQKGDRAARETAAKSLASSAPADCTAALVKALDDESPVVRSAMLQALERLKASETATAIARRLADDADRTAACRALKQIGASAAPAVLPYVDHERAPVRQAACELLEAAKLDRAAATSTLGKLLGRLDDDEAVRSAAILAIRRQVASAAGLEPGTAATDPGVPERLLKVLAGGLASPRVPGRVWALRLVAVLGKPAQGLSAQVVKLLDDPSAEVRELAADTLLLIRQAGKQTPSGKDRQAGPATVTEMPANLTSGLVRFLEDSDPAMRYWTARLIGALGVGGKSAIPALVRLCDDPDTAVRCAAVQAVQDLCTAICDGRALLLARVREMAEQINALGQGSQSRALELSKDLLAGLERIWPVAADCQFAQGSRGRQSTTGPNSAEWFGYGGAGDWREFAVLPDRPFLLSTRGDGQMIDSIRFTISENEGGAWVVKETIQGPTGFDGYRWYVHTPSSDHLRITAQGWFYLYLYQLQGASGCGKEEAAQADTSAGGFREWVKNPEYKRQVAEAAAAREQQRRALQVPENISDDEIRAMVQRLFLPEDDDFNYERLKLVGAKPRENRGQGTCRNTSRGGQPVRRRRAGRGQRPPAPATRTVLRKARRSTREVG